MTTATKVRRLSKNWLKMGLATLCLLYLAACTLATSSPTSRALTSSVALPSPRSLRYPPLQFNIPKAERRQLKNGLIIYLLPDHEIPIVDVTALIRTGSVYELPDQIGVAQLTAEVMRTGGTSSMSAEKLDEELEFHSIHINTTIDRESGSASLSVLTKDLDKGLELFFDVLRNPAFSQEKVNLAKDKKIESIRRKNDSPQDIAFREFRKILYRGDPRGREATIAGIQKLTRQDMVNFHQRYFHPDNIIMGISGDFQPEEIIEKLEKLTAGWSPLQAPVPPPPVPSGKTVKSINYISRKLPQSIIVTGGFSVPQNHPDYFAFLILDHLLGGDGFNSYLTEEIRSSRGLAYSVGSFYNGYINYGVSGAYCFTNSSSTILAISLIYQILDRVKRGQISPDKLKWAKESILNQFIFSFNSSEAVVEQLISLEYYGLPKDYLDRFQENIRRVSLEDVQRVARQYLQPENNILLVLGDDEQFEQPLNKFGFVNIIDIEHY
ncbi:MAG: insulinase family protein [bacterium]|nr:insulinase family protein [bacterium]